MIRIVFLLLIPLDFTYFVTLMINFLISSIALHRMYILDTLMRLLFVPPMDASYFNSILNKVIYNLIFFSSSRSSRLYILSSILLWVDWIFRLWRKIIKTSSINLFQYINIKIHKKWVYLTERARSRYKKFRSFKWF